MDDIVNPTSSYYWTPSHPTTLDAYLDKNRPSMVVDDGTKPWIWVEKGSGRDSDIDEDIKAIALMESSQCVEKTTKKVTDIQNDSTIPTRSNKKTGARSKKELREEAHAEAASELKRLALESGYTCGKWLFFASHETVDGTFSKIATSLVSGALSSTPAFLTKVATSKPTGGPDALQHVICLYLPNIFDKDAVTEVLKALISKVGLTPMSCKADLYTVIGLDSKHPSGIRSTVWQTKELLKEDEIKKLRDEFSASQKKPTKAPKPTKAEDDPFASDGDEEAAAAAIPQVKVQSVLKGRQSKNVEDPFASESDENELPKKKTSATKAKTQSKTMTSKKPTSKPSSRSLKPASKGAAKRKLEDSSGSEDANKTVKKFKAKGIPDPIAEEDSVTEPDD